ncbi:DUF6412 domain-containing protein [Amycolatopsis sp. NPDC059027]|uniref:DUF6412 domain-containing protein n=1 Tax=unclassified Amycolatopsis TaxID=2618356 RepID=UPI00366B7AD1
MTTLLALAFPALTSATALVAFASVVAASLLVVLLVSRAHGDELALWSAPTRGRAIALRQRARRAEFIRLRDPGAPGRSRPRAPGTRSTAA